KTAIAFWNSSSGAGVAMTRYLRTKAATPRAASHCATNVPSLSQERKRNPPPGQTMTAVPFAEEGSGRKAVSVGVTILRTIFSFVLGFGYSISFCVHVSDPGATPGQTGMTGC